MKKLFFLLFLLAFSLVQATNDKKVYMIDVSGSMIGEGSIRTSNVFQLSINELKNAISVMEDSVEIVIVPFAENVHKPIVGNSSEKEYLLKQIDSIRVSGKRTDLFQAYIAALKEIDSVVKTEVYFITDGYHNGKKDTNVLFSKLNEYPNSTQARTCTLYYYLTDGQYRDMTVCKIFDKNNNMELVESLVKQKQNIIQEANDETAQTIVKERQPNGKGLFSFLLNLGLLWIIILILLALVFLYAIGRFVLPNLGGFHPSVSAPNVNAGNITNTSSDQGTWPLNKINDVLSNDKSSVAEIKHACDQYDKGNFSEENFNKLSKETQDRLEKYWSVKYNDSGYKNIPQQHGHWKGEEGNSKWVFDPNHVHPAKTPYNNPGGKTDGQIYSENNVEDGIPYDGGNPDFSQIEKARVGFNWERNLGNAGVEKLCGGNREQLHEIAFQKLAEQMGSTVDVVKAMKESQNLVWHELEDCKTIILVPREIHDNLPHVGGVAYFKAFMGY